MYSDEDIDFLDHVPKKLTKIWIDDHDILTLDDNKEPVNMYINKNRPFCMKIEHPDLFVVLYCDENNDSYLSIDSNKNVINIDINKNNFVNNAIDLFTKKLNQAFDCIIGKKINVENDGYELVEI